MGEQEYGDAAYAPFGEPYAIGKTPYLSFTGQNQDTISGTYDFLFREYNPVQGRWISPDPSGLNAVNPSNPQSWNRYAYVLNNPLSNVDPLGLYCAYLNDGGDGVESIDDNSGVGECGGNGGYWIEGSYGGGSWVNANADTGLVTGLGYDSSGNAEISIAGAMGSNANGAWTQTWGGAQGSSSWWGTFGGNLFSNWSWGVRGPNQSYRQCLATNSGNYSLAGLAGLDSGGAKVIAGNDVASLLFGDASEGQAGLLLAEGGTHSINAGIGTAGTMGRRTASVFDLNLAGTTGPAPAILGKTGAEEVAGALSGLAEGKFAGDVGATGALMLGCLFHP